MAETNENIMVEEEGISLLELFNLVKENIIAIIAFVFVTTLIGSLYTILIEKPTYTATTSLIVQVSSDNTTSEYTDILVSEKLVKTFTVFIESQLVLGGVSQSLTTDDINLSVDQLKSGLSVTNITSSLILELKWTSESATEAAEIVNQVAAAAVAAANTESYTYLNDKLVILDVAMVPTVAEKNTLLNIAISIILGGLLSVIYIFIKEVTNVTFKSYKEIEKVLGLPVLSSAPDLGEDY